MPLKLILCTVRTATDSRRHKCSIRMVYSWLLNARMNCIGAHSVTETEVFINGINTCDHKE